MCFLNKIRATSTPSWTKILFCFSIQKLFTFFIWCIVIRANFDNLVTVWTIYACRSKQKLLFSTQFTWLLWLCISCIRLFLTQNLEVVIKIIIIIIRGTTNSQIEKLISNFKIIIQALILDEYKLISIKIFISKNIFILQYLIFLVNHLYVP